MGAIRDMTNSFDIPFIIGGISFIASALMHFAIMWLNRQEENKTKNKTETTTSPSELTV